jgi:hypothetical protein
MIDWVKNPGAWACRDYWEKFMEAYKSHPALLFSDRQDTRGKKVME